MGDGKKRIDITSTEEIRDTTGVVKISETIIEARVGGGG